MVLDGKSSKEFPVGAGVPQRAILGPTLKKKTLWPLFTDGVQLPQG